MGLHKEILVKFLFLFDHVEKSYDVLSTALCWPYFLTGSKYFSLNKQNSNNKINAGILVTFVKI